MIPRFDRLIETVQANCHITDARHARNMTMCTYLLEMREFYRWEHGVAQTAPLPRSDVASWLSGREALWSAFEDAEYRRLPVDGGEVDPFDVEAVNRALLPHDLVYGAGIGRFGKPQFFLGALEREEWRDGVRILVARCEYARDLAPAAAALRDGTITVRLESLRRVLWEKVEGWAVKRSDGALRAALDAYDFAGGADAALERMAAAEAETLILHELGEVRAGRLLGPEWEAMLAGLTRRRAEVFARAARDHLADCLVTLPALLERDAGASLHLWFANLDGMRRELFPRLVDAYAMWRRGDDGEAIRAGAPAGAAHWERVCRQLLALAADRGADAEAAIEALSTMADVRL
jgi:hypothetical protein